MKRKIDVKASGTARRRAVPHVVGNFHTLVYIKVPVDERLSVYARRAHAILSSLDRRANTVENNVYEDHTSSSDSDTTNEDELLEGHRCLKTRQTFAHLSLCRPMYLKRQFIKPFIEQLQRSLTRIKPFYLILDKEIAILANEDHTSFFAALPVENMCNTRAVLPLIDIVDDVAEVFGYPKYYEQRLPHVSLAVIGRNLQNIIADLYSKQRYCRDTVYSSHHWLHIENLLEVQNEKRNSNEAASMVEDAREQKQTSCKEIDNEDGDQTARHEIQFTFAEETLKTSTTGLSDQDEQPICIYVEDIYVLVGAQETVIKLLE